MENRVCNCGPWILEYLMDLNIILGVEELMTVLGK